MRTCLASWTRLETRPGTRPLAIAWPLVVAASSLGMTAGCSKPPDSAIAPAGSALHADTAVTTESNPRDVLHGEGSVGGVPTRYSAYFEATQLRRISETRQPQGAGEHVDTGEYVFHGARLVEYQGTAPDSAVDIELHFDSQDALVPPTGNAPQIDAADLRSIRTRAQLLRSLVLARRSTETHTAQH